MKREKALAKNTLIIAIGTCFPKLAALITLPIITSELTKTEYGTYDLINTLVSLFLPVVTLQIQSAGFRFLIDLRDDDWKKKEVISTIYFFALPMSVVALVFLYFCLGRLQAVTRILICVYFFIDILSLLTQQIVRGLSYNKMYSANACIHSFANMILIIWTVKYGKWGLNGVLISTFVSTTVGVVYMFARARLYRFISVRTFSKKELVEMLCYSWPMIPNSLSSWVLSVSDRLVLTGFLGLESVAVYAAANKIPALIATVQGTFVFAWQENASLVVKDKDSSDYYSQMFDTIFSILSGIVALLIGVTPILFWLLIKGDYSDAYPHMPILFMGIFFSTVSSFLGGIYVAHKRTRNVGLTTMLAATSNLAIDFALVKYVGIYAASISTFVSYTLLAVYRMHNVKNFREIEYNYFKIFSFVFFLAAMCMICWFNMVVLNIVNCFLGVVFAIASNRELIMKALQAIKNRV